MVVLARGWRHRDGLRAAPPAASGGYSFTPRLPNVARDEENMLRFSRREVVKTREEGGVEFKLECSATRIEANGNGKVKGVKMVRGRAL